MARKIDSNGWFESQDNPISKAGVFPYVGKRIPGAPDPDRIYYVYRPPEELADPDCVESFKLLPWTNDHPPGLLGDEEEGLTPAEQKGVQGVIGENVYYKEGVIYGNIKAFSQAMTELIDAGKKELSPGYRSKYEWRSGEAFGQHYDVIQRQVRGNHLSLVDEGRMGPDVAVLDAFTLDSKDFIEMNEDENNTEVSLEDGINIFMQMLPALQKLAAASAGTAVTDPDATTTDPDAVVTDPGAEPALDEDDPDKNNGNPAVTTDEDDPNKKDDKGTADEDDDKTAAALDSMDKEIKALKRDGFKNVMREVTRRDQLVKRLSPHVGTFDAADMTAAEVAKYGVKKLGIAAPKGQEMAFLDGYLNGVVKAPKATVLNGVGLDSVDSKSPISQYLTGEKK